MEKVLNRLPFFTTKEEEVKVEILGIENNGIIVEHDKKEFLVTWKELSIYSKQMDDQRKLYSMIGTYITLLMIKKNGNLSLSRAKYMQKRLSNLHVGDKVIVTVTSADNGALYVETPDGLIGKIYTNQLTSSKVRQPLDIYNIGDKITCSVKKIREDGYIEFSRIDLYKGKETIIKRGDIISCRITSPLTNKTGNFAEYVYNPIYSGIVDKFPGIQYTNGQVVDLYVKEVNGKHLKLRPVIN